MVPLILLGMGFSQDAVWSVYDAAKVQYPYVSP